MKKIAARMSIALLFLLTPISAAAEPPSFVTGIHAEQMEDGTIAITWNPPEGGDAVSHYNVYYASKSILETNGLWDDVEATEGSVPAATLRNFPPVQTLFISVLAVNENGEESPFFTEETAIELRVAPDVAPEAQETQEEISAPAPDALHLLNVEAVSATGVLLTFSAPLTLDEEHASEIVTVTTGSGTRLRITKLISKDATLLIHTEVQERNRPYKVMLSQDFIRGIVMQSGEKASVTLQGSADPVLFLGHSDGLVKRNDDMENHSEEPPESRVGVDYAPPEKPAKLPPTGFGIVPLVAITGGLLGGMKARRRKKLA